MSAVPEPLPLVPYVPQPQLPAALEKLASSHDEFLKNRRAASTRRLYASHWRGWQAWCAGHGLAPTDPTPETVALYLRHRAEKRSKPATIQVVLAAIEYYLNECSRSVAHERIVRDTIAAIRRAYKSERRPKQAALADDVTRMVAAQPDTLYGLRNQALLLVGFLSAMRRSELVAIDVKHLEWDNEGVSIHIPSSKTDQTGEGQSVSLLYLPHAPYCPAMLLRKWLTDAGIKEGAVFRPVDPRNGAVRPQRLSAERVADIVKDAAIRIGQPAEIYAGHSLRSGFVTESANRGIPLPDIMMQTRHTDPKTCLRYIRKKEQAKRNPARAFWAQPAA